MILKIVQKPPFALKDTFWAASFFFFLFLFFFFLDHFANPKVLAAQRQG